MKARRGGFTETKKKAFQGGRRDQLSCCWEAAEDEDTGVTFGFGRREALETLARTAQWNVWTKPVWTAGRRGDMETSLWKACTVGRTDGWCSSLKNFTGFAVRLSATSLKWNWWRHFKFWGPCCTGPRERWESGKGLEKMEITMGKGRVRRV